ncbi:hypothetical protein ACFQGR_08070 [Weissella sagaensis]|uniref:Bacteriocin n=1 Tax=Weissella sagaensis TaxID=2559928 RepID=A0ABW1RV70_9LACO|nr:hypothetical protein [Weissella sagaensis]MBU7567567.1 hypothetical protein [Weissella hellenica]UEG67721.1 hypothetical protein GZH44_04245 [Weissella hellenica]
MDKFVYENYKAVSEAELVNISGGAKHPVRQWLWHKAGDPVVSFGKGFLKAFG